MFSGLRRTVFVSVYIFTVIYCLQVIPERTNITFINHKYIEYAEFTITRYGRRSGYYMNVMGSIKHTWGNNITLDFIFFEYLHNEYRRSFVEMHFRYCDLINKEAYIGGMLAKQGIKCPTPKGAYRLMNMTVPTENFPHLFPFEKGRVDLSIRTNTEVMGNVSIYTLFKNDLKKKH